MQYAWTCGCCGKQFDSLPLDYAFEAPLYWCQLAEAERPARARLTADFCSIDGEDHFVRGCLEIPILGQPERLIFGVWVSLSAESMRRALEIWDKTMVEDEPPRFGWLSNRLPLYPDTLNLKTRVHFRSGGLRPAIELEATDHPLALEQRRGITLARMEEIAAALGRHH